LKNRVLHPLSLPENIEYKYFIFFQLFLYMNFTSDRLDFLNNINEKLDFNNTNDIIFIYSLPKVGSTSLVSSLRLFGFEKFTIVHLHDEYMLKILTGVENITINELILYNSFIGKNVYVIDIYRTPIERKISEYFDDLCHYHFNNTLENVLSYKIERIINRFNKIVMHMSNEDYYFERYGIPHIDKFDFYKKYLMQVVNGVKYIKLRLKDSHLWGDILTDILGINIKIIKDCETSNKGISELYERFKREYRLPVNNIKDLEEDRNLLYYMEEGLRSEYIDMWRSKSMKEVIGYLDYNLYNDISSENSYLNKIDYDHYKVSNCKCNLCKKELLKARIMLLKGVDNCVSPFAEGLKLCHKKRAPRPAPGPAPVQRPRHRLKLTNPGILPHYSGINTARILGAPMGWN